MSRTFSTKELEAAYGANVHNRFPVYKGEIIAILLKEKFENRTAILSRELRPSLEMLQNQSASTPLFTWVETSKQWQYRGHYRLVNIEPRTNRMLCLTFEFDSSRVLPSSEAGSLSDNIAMFHPLNYGNQFGNRVLSKHQIEMVSPNSSYAYDGLFERRHNEVVRIRTEIELKANTPTITFTLNDDQLDFAKGCIGIYCWSRVPIFSRIGYNLWKFIGNYDFEGIDEEAKTITFSFPIALPRKTDYSVFANKSNSVIHPNLSSPLSRNAKRSVMGINNLLIALEFAAAFLITYCFYRGHPTAEEAFGGTIFLGATIWRKFHPAITDMVFGKLPEDWYEKRDPTGDYYDF